MILQQAVPAVLESRGRRRPSHLRLAVGVSLAIHAAAGPYLAYAHFAPPLVREADPGPVIIGPLVPLKPDRLKPVEPLKRPTHPLHTPVIRDTSPIQPLPEEPTPHLPPLVDPQPFTPPAETPAPPLQREVSLNSSSAGRAPARQ